LHSGRRAAKGHGIIAMYPGQEACAIFREAGNESGIDELADPERIEAMLLPIHCHLSDILFSAHVQLSQVVVSPVTYFRLPS
jgi:hypothetical protein